MSGTTARRDALAERVVAPFTALVMLAVQVGSSATRDALFLTSFSVTSLPWFVALAALVTLLAAHGTGSLLARYGPRRTVPATFGLNAALFGAEAWLLQPLPTTAAVLLYLHTTVLGAIATSTFWSLLNERIDPHSAKRLFSRVAGAASLGAVIGGVGAERVAAFQSPGVLLAVLAGGAAACVAGTLVVARGGDRGAGGDEHVTPAGASSPPAHTPYVRELALVATLAALVGTLCDYVLKADVAAHAAGSAPMIRLFGLFYAATGVAALVVQAAFAPAVLGRLGIAGAIAAHPLAVGVAGLASLAAPAPWRGMLLRSADATIRRSLFRTGYELLYTPLPDLSRRSVKTTIDVGWDCVGNGAGAAVVFLLTRLLVAQDIAAVTVACIVVAGAELVCARRLRSGYVTAMEVNLRRRGASMPRVTLYKLSHVTMTDLVPPDSDGPTRRGTAPAPRQDATTEALAALRWEDPARIRPALRQAEQEVLLVGAVIALLERTDLLDDVAATLRAHGARVAGQLADALVNPATPEVVRRRLPLVMRSCASKRALAGLTEGLSDRSFAVRQRCCPGAARGDRR